MDYWTLRAVLDICLGLLITTKTAEMTETPKSTVWRFVKSGPQQEMFKYSNK
jgi:hypothetical protein